MSSGCGDVLSLADLQTAKKHQIFEAEVITGKSGGVAGGADIDYATNQVTGQVQKTLPAILRDAGFRPAAFTFTTGGTLNVGDSDMAVLWPTASGGDGQYYIWKGAYPKTIPAESTPASTGGVGSSGWLPLGDITLRAEMAALDGAKLVNKKKAGADTVATNLLNRGKKIYDAVDDYGADPTGTNDSYAALQAWVNASIADPWSTATINGIFKISQPLEFANVTGLTILANCYIYPTYTTGDAVIQFRNGQGIRIYGRFEASGQNQVNIKAAFKMFSDNANGFSFNYFYGLCASDAAIGIQLGDIAYPSALVSELSFHGGFCVGTPCAIKAIGTQTYVNFTSFDAVSGAAGDLSVVTQYTIWTQGAQVKFIGGEIQHNNNIFGAAVLVEPVNDPTHGNTYGNFSSEHSHIETAAQLCLIANLDSIASPISLRSAVNFTGSHGYHSQDNGAMIGVHSSASDYAGTISTRDMSLYCGVIRTQPNILAGNNTVVSYDPTGFGWQFVSGLQAVSGGILKFTRQPVMRVYNTAAQSIGTSATVVKYTTPQTSDDMYRWQAQYSASTGRFTVPVGGLKNVEVRANLRVATGACQLDVYVNSTLKTLKSPEGVAPSVSVMLGDLAAGDYIDIRATMTSAPANTNGGDLEGFTIIAER